MDIDAVSFKDPLEGDAGAEARITSSADVHGFNEFLYLGYRDIDTLGYVLKVKKQRKIQHASRRRRSKTIMVKCKLKIISCLLQIQMSISIKF